MFTPSQINVRQFFCGVYQKTIASQAMTALEKIASEWILEHPELHTLLADTQAALEITDERQKEHDNPFLHLSMHLSLTEQCSINQPVGIRQAVEHLAEQMQSLHEAHHATMECLGRMLWESQRSGLPPDGNTYMDCVQRLVTA